jgi:hypothetical protein
VRSHLFGSDPNGPPTVQEEQLLQDIRRRRGLVWVLMAVVLAMGASGLFLPGRVAAVLVGIATIALTVVRLLAALSQCPRCGERYSGFWEWEQKCIHCGLPLHQGAS